MIISSIKYEYLRYKKLGEGAIKQTSEDGLNKVFGDDNNSISIIVAHIAGNLNSRFTDFLTTDGEKQWRIRNTEFDERNLTKSELLQLWDDGWVVLLTTLDELSDDDLDKTIYNKRKRINRSRCTPPFAYARKLPRWANCLYSKNDCWEGMEISVYSSRRE